MYAPVELLDPMTRPPLVQMACWPVLATDALETDPQPAVHFAELVNKLAVL